MSDYSRPTYTDGYEIRYNRDSDQFECCQNGVVLPKKDGKPASYRALGLAIKFMAASGAKEAVPEPKQRWTPPAAAQIAPLAEQLATLPDDAPRFVLIEAPYGHYHEQGYACYDREKQEIVCSHTYNGINFITKNKAEAEAEVAYRLEHGVAEGGPEFDLVLFNAVFGDEIRKSGDAQPEIIPGSKEEATYNRQKAAWQERKADAKESSTPLPAERETIVNEQLTVGEIVSRHDRQYLVTACDFLNEADVDEAEEGFDAFVFLGWNSSLVALDAAVMTKLSERFKAGEAQFTSSITVKFSDEQYAHDLRDLRYSKDRGGLYDEKVSR